jgi:hypothetical protein
MVASILVTDRVEGHFAVTLGNAQDAAALAEQVKPQLAASQAYFDRFEVHAVGDTLETHVAITEAQIKTLVAIFAGLGGSN